MIYCSKKNLSRYLGLNKNLDTAIKHLIKCNSSEIKLGRNEIDGDLVYANCFEYETQPEEIMNFEAHLAYADIHIMLKGKERMDVSHIDILKEFEKRLEDDYIGYKGPISSTYEVNEEMLLIVFPEDAHKVKVAIGKPSQVKKLVYKVKL